LQVGSHRRINVIMNAQQEHDYEMSKRDLKLSKESEERLEKLLAEKGVGADPVSAQMARHKGLTAEKAVEMAEALGF
jgi:hypothetical protein